MPYISEIERGWDDVIAEGPGRSLLGPVYWRIVTRGDKKLFCSTFMLTRDLVTRGWGTKALAYCDPLTGQAAARIEALSANPTADIQEIYKFGPTGEMAMALLLFGESQVGKMVAEEYERLSPHMQHEFRLAVQRYRQEQV